MQHLIPLLNNVYVHSGYRVQVFISCTQYTSYIFIYMKENFAFGLNGFVKYFAINNVLYSYNISCIVPHFITFVIIIIILAVKNVVEIIWWERKSVCIFLNRLLHFSRSFLLFCKIHLVRWFMNDEWFIALQILRLVNCEQ